MALQFALRHPDLIAGAFSYGAYFYHGSHIYDVLKKDVNHSSLAKHRPILMMNGRNDTIVKPEWARDTRNELNKLGVPVEIRFVDGAGHAPVSDVFQQATDFFVDVLDGKFVTSTTTATSTSTMTTRTTSTFTSTSTRTTKIVTVSNLESKP